ncbi:MAG: CBS domain-containing protein [Crenarchaeota archaeon]|nr:CBS domain-containing protein [Thermoproteota archaeon]
MVVKVGDVASKKLITITPSATLREAAETMIKNGVSFLVIMEDSKLYGVISEKDIVRCIAEGRDVNTTRVGEVCTREVITIREDAPLQEAARLMRQHRIRHLVVVDGSGKPIGVISIRDLVREEATLRKIEALTPDQLDDWWFG